jgi:galactose oxidase
VTSNTWTLLPGAVVAPMLTNDAQGVYRADNHGWLFGWKSGYVFQAGPSKAMNWYGTTGTGSQSAAGLRASDADSMCGNAVSIADYLIIN